VYFLASKGNLFLKSA